MQELTVQIKENAFHHEMATSLWTMHHLHKDIEIIYVRHGSSTAYIDGREMPIIAGDLLLVCPNQIHYYEKTVSGLYQVLTFSSNVLFDIQSLLRNYLPTENVFHLSPNSFSVKLLDELTTQEQRYQYTRQLGLINCLMAELLATVELVPHPPFNDKTIKTILNYCEQNYNVDITLQEMADALHLNKTHISRVFSQKIGQNFKSYVNTLRITKACELLRDTDDAISDISERVGFGSFRSFNRAFMSMMNMTPSEYRKSLSAAI